MMNDYVGPSLDTTIFATQAAIRLFAENPDQWNILREKPAPIPNAVNKVVRLEAPIQNFSRVTTQDFSVEDISCSVWASHALDLESWPVCHFHP